jgi:hypothetical protein
LKKWLPALRKNESSRTVAAMAFNGPTSLPDDFRAVALKQVRLSVLTDLPRLLDIAFGGARTV